MARGREQKLAHLKVFSLIRSFFPNPQSKFESILPKKYIVLLPSGSILLDTCGFLEIWGVEKEAPSN
jgi:hypothetical protein